MQNRSHHSTPLHNLSFVCCPSVSTCSSHRELNMQWHGREGECFLRNSGKHSRWWEKNTSQCKADNPISELLQIALISEEQGDGDALYSEWQVLHCKGKALKDSNSALEIYKSKAKYTLQSLLEQRQENTLFVKPKFQGLPLIKLNKSINSTTTIKRVHSPLTSKRITKKNALFLHFTPSSARPDCPVTNPFDKTSQTKLEISCTLAAAPPNPPIQKIGGPLSSYRSVPCWISNGAFSPHLSTPGWPERPFPPLPFLPTSPLL